MLLYNVYSYSTKFLEQFWINELVKFWNEKNYLKNWNLWNFVGGALKPDSSK